MDTDSRFSAQFDRAHSVDFYGNAIVFTDVTPPSHLAKQGSLPVLLAPGWGETPRTFKDTIYALYQEGYRVLCLEHPRHDLKLITRQNLPHLELQKAEAILQVLRELKIERADVLAHSEGAINSIIAASLMSDRFRKIILVGPGGLVEREAFPELFSRFFMHLFEGLARAVREPGARKQLIRSEKEVLKYFMRNPLLALLEGSAISHSKLRDLVTSLQEKGLEISIIHGTDDWLFPIKKMRSFVSQTKAELHLIPGDHHDIYADPKRLMPYIVKDLDSA